MPIYKLKSPRKYGDMPEGYEFRIESNSSPTPTAQDIEVEIKRLGWNKEAQSYKNPANFEVTKI